MEAEVAPVEHLPLADLLAGQWHYDVRICLLLVVLHHFKFDVDDLHDPIKDHVIVELKLLVQIVLLFQ